MVTLVNIFAWQGGAKQPAWWLRMAWSSSLTERVSYWLRLRLEPQPRTGQLYSRLLPSNSLLDSRYPKTLGQGLKDGNGSSAASRCSRRTPNTRNFDTGSYRTWDRAPWGREP